MKCLILGLVGNTVLFSGAALCAAQDGPYLPLNSKGILVAPDGNSNLNSSIPTFAPNDTYSPSNGPNLSPTPNRQPATTPYSPTPSTNNFAPNSAPSSSIPQGGTTNPTQNPTSGPTQSQSLKPEERSIIPSQSNFQSMEAPATIAVPGGGATMGFPQPYWTGFRGMGLFGPRPWIQQTNYGPYGAPYGNGCNTCEPPPCNTCPVGMPNFEFGRGYDGFMTGW